MQVKHKHHIFVGMEKILIIEDNTAIRENLEEYFDLEGYKTLTSSNGKKGIELAKEFSPGLIICDVLMPEMDGYKILRLLKKTKQTSSIPFIFSTSMSESIDKKEALELGADDYIVKPFELETLLKMAKSCIQGKSSPVKV